MSLLITKISTQTMTQKADILFPIYDLIHNYTNNFIDYVHWTQWCSGSHGGLPILRMRVRFQVTAFFFIIIIIVRIQH